MNILLTDKCSNNCPYCFAKEKLKEKNLLNQMSPENFIKILAFLKKSSCHTVKLLGGEPMLHSNISDIINMASRNDYFQRIILFSGGIFDHYLVSLLNHEKISVVLNTNHPSDYENGKWDIFMRNLDYMVSSGSEVTLGYNIYKTDFDYEFILELLEYYKLKNLRWTVAVPVYSYDNSHVPLDDYRKMGKKITEFLLKASELKVKAHLDCFVPLCTFSDSDYGKLVKIFPGMAKGGLCNPAIDVGPDMRVWRCFSMSGYENVSLEDFEDLKSLSDFFISSFDRYKWYIWPEKCEHCKYRLSKICQSSCLSFKAVKINEFLRNERNLKEKTDTAKELFSGGNYGKALEIYKEALLSAPYSLSIKSDMALTFIKSGDLQKAEKLLNEIEEEFSDYPSLYVYKALIYEEKHDYKHAVLMYRKALRICPRDEHLKERIKKARSLEILKMSL